MRLEPHTSMREDSIAAEQRAASNVEFYFGFSEAFRFCS